MSEENKALETRVRDSEESIRNLNRIGGETITAIRSLHQRLSKAQEFALRDNRLTAEDYKEALKAFMAELAGQKAIEKTGAQNQQDLCEAHRGRTGILETDIKWIKGGLVTAWAAILGLFGVKQ